MVCSAAAYSTINPRAHRAEYVRVHGSLFGQTHRFVPYLWGLWLIKTLVAAAINDHEHTHRRTVQAMPQLLKIVLHGTTILIIGAEDFGCTTALCLFC